MLVIKDVLYLVQNRVLLGGGRVHARQVPYRPYLVLFMVIWAQKVSFLNIGVVYEYDSFIRVQ